MSVAAAAERLRANSWDVYGKTPETTDEWFALADKLTADGRRLADSFLAEHPADDSLGLDEAWLRSVGFNLRKGLDGGIYAWLSGDLNFDIEDSSVWCHGTRIAENISTRCEFRALCRVLKIPLKG